jgi:hypothetical protein
VNDRRVVAKIAGMFVHEIWLSGQTSTRQGRNLIRVVPSRGGPKHRIQLDINPSAASTALRSTTASRGVP